MPVRLLEPVLLFVLCAFDCFFFGFAVLSRDIVWLFTYVFLLDQVIVVELPHNDLAGRLKDVLIICILIF